MYKVLIALALFLFAPLVIADKPPQALYEHVTTTSQLVHRGECKVPSMNVEGRTCLIFFNPSIDRVWVVLFSQDKDGNNYVTHVLLIDEIGKEVVAWCHEKVCV
jgi:hypothetical protein